ncbi:MAG TPA: hypothetical protein ENK47_01640, partial [Euryarchaeota archaeon]|nr:hypothetical protein [Euryarchaeota archaeon]
KGSYQTDHGSDGFGDEPYNIVSSESDRYPIFIDNIKPTADGGKDRTIKIGEKHHFDATNSIDDQLVTSYVWSFYYDDTHVIRDYGEFDFIFNIAGEYICSLQVYDFARNTDSDIIVIKVVDDIIPEIVSQGNITINQGEVAFFTANGTFDHSSIIKYIWKFNYQGENIVLNGITTSFLFNEVGVHDILLEVHDSEGNIGYHHFHVNVIDTENPIAFAGEDIEVINGDTVELDGTDSTDNGMTSSYEWTFIYGGEDITLIGKRNSFVFNIPGIYTITLRVMDEYNNFDTDEIEITVVDTIPPVAKITGKYKLLEGESLQLDGSSSEDNGQITKYVWTIVDGEEKTVEGPELKYTFNGQGYFDILLTVYDQWDNSDSVNITVEVPDTIDPIAVCGDDLIVKIGSIVSFDGSGSTDNSGISDYKWSFTYRGIEEALHGEFAEFKFEDAGEYEIKLTITDNFLNRGTDTFTVTVMDTGTLKGVVKDSSGNPIDGATITVTDMDGNQFTTTSGSDGSFEIDVPEGEVVWKIKKSGYETIEGFSSITIMEETVLQESDTQMEKEESGLPIFLFLIGIILLFLIICIIIFIIIKSIKSDEKDEVQEEIKEGHTESIINETLEVQELNYE